MTDTATHTLGVKQHGQGHPDHVQEDVALLKSHKLKPHPTIPRATKPILICVRGCTGIRVPGFVSGRCMMLLCFAW